MNIGTFIGKWYIQFTGGVAWLQEDWILMIGTDSEHGDKPPFLTEEYAVCVGFTVLDLKDQNPVQLSTEDHPGNQPLVLRLTGEQLRWKGYYKQQPLYIYIAAAETWTPVGEKYTHIFGSTTYGDPEQMAVWGGSGTPPPPPEPEPKTGE
jgi:hypothetical protein